MFSRYLKLWGRVVVIVDWRTVDIKNPTQEPGEKDSIYLVRCKEAGKASKAEAKHRHSLIEKKFLEPLGVHFEPVLRPSKPEKIQPYLANEVAHTRIIDTLQVPRGYQSESSWRAFKQARNHDGYRMPYQLYRAERFNLKACWLVHAHQPSMVIKDQLAINYHIKEQIKAGGLDPRQLQSMLAYLAANHTTGFFNKKTFQHYRHWFFDLDHVSIFEEVRARLKDLGLLDFLVVATETSKGKFHLYFKSELIANQQQVQGWSASNKAEESILPYDQNFVAELKKKVSNPMHPDWQMIAKRGVVDGWDIHRSNIPLPLGVRAGVCYRGDNATHDQYRDLWGRMNKVLGGDAGVLDGTRVAQLPFYRNPKNNFMCDVVYSQPNAPVMRLGDVLKVFPNGEINVAVRHPELETTKKEVPDVVEVVLEEKIEEQQKVVQKEKEVAFTFTELLDLPANPEEYARQNNLSEKISWDLDITGRSNAMLLLLSKYAWRYVDLYNDQEVEAFWAAVVEPYLRLRTSNGLVKDLGLKDFKKRYLICCSTNRRWDHKKPQVLGSEDLLKLSKLEIERRDPNFFINLSFADENHYERILQYIADTLERGYVKGVTTKDDKTLLYKFFLPITYLRDTIPGYNKKLTVLAKLGFFTREKSFVSGKKCKTCRMYLDNALVKAYLEEKKSTVVAAEPENEWAAMAARLESMVEPIEEPDFGPVPDILTAKAEPIEEVLTEEEREKAIAEKRQELWELNLDPADFATSPELEYLDDELDKREALLVETNLALKAEVAILNASSDNWISNSILNKFLFDARGMAEDRTEEKIAVAVRAHFSPMHTAILIYSDVLKLRREIRYEYGYLRELALAKARNSMHKDGMTPEAKNDRKFKIMNEMAKLVFKKSEILV